MTSTRLVLLDFDGTLADTAPDLAGAAIDMQLARELAPTDYAALRAVASHGARGLLSAAFGISPGQPDYEPMRLEFLDRYEQRMTRHTRLFDGVDTLLARLDQRNIAWGIVTNKATRFTHPIVSALGLVPGVVVCGDTTPHIKPHPEPLLHAARQLSIAPSDCIYVGDDLRDIQAGQAAGMRTIVAAYGYLGAAGSPDSWGADHVAATVADLHDLLKDG
jgi:phosphoglycolate phosphatase